jgi:NAD(P)-dependent dehydrogenase (short-subunit alcohol dehydrogenase family)
MGKLAGKVAVITGGSSGIGLAAAQLFVEEGAFVFITGRRQAELDKAVGVIGRSVMAVQGDVSDLDDLDRLYKTVATEKGGLDIVVANAAVVSISSLADATPEHFDGIFNVNARGTFFTVQKALSLLRDGGSIVLVSSAGHLLGVQGYTVYAATKAAIRSFARGWAAELAPRKIRVNCLSPGGTETPILEGHLGERAAEMKKLMAERNPLGRIAHAGEIASAILFLGSNESSYSTGIDLIADGGFTQV